MVAGVRTIAAHPGHVVRSMTRFPPRHPIEGARKLTRQISCAITHTVIYILVSFIARNRRFMTLSDQDTLILLVVQTLEQDLLQRGLGPGDSRHDAPDLL